MAAKAAKGRLAGLSAGDIQVGRIFIPLGTSRLHHTVATSSFGIFGVHLLGCGVSQMSHPVTRVLRIYLLAVLTREVEKRRALCHCTADD